MFEESCLQSRCFPFDICYKTKAVSLIVRGKVYDMVAHGVVIFILWWWWCIGSTEDLAAGTAVRGHSALVTWHGGMGRMVEIWETQWEAVIIPVDSEFEREKLGERAQMSVEFNLKHLGQWDYLSVSQGKFSAPSSRLRANIMPVAKDKCEVIGLPCTCPFGP